MRSLYITLFLLLLLSTGCNAQAPATADSDGLLALTRVIPLTGVEGRIDHFALDIKGGRLFMAALGNNTVEVIDLASGKVASQITGLRTPQGVAFAPDANRLAVANDADGSCRLFDGTSLHQLASIDLKDDADNVRYDAAAKRFWVGYGDGGLTSIDAFTGRRLTDVKLDAHPESFQLESRGNRIFVNVPRAGHVAVIDREKSSVIAKWSLKGAAANFPMALDEADHRLFIGCRQPPKLLVLDTQTGKTVASLDVVGDTDDLWYNSARKQLYVSGGEGAVTVISQKDENAYAVLGRVKTAPGARTSFFVPQDQTLYVAVPHHGEQKAELRAFQPPKPS